MNAFDKMNFSKSSQKNFSKSSQNEEKPKEKPKKRKEKKPVEYNPTYSLTVGNGGENHAGMEFIGQNEKERWGLGFGKIATCKGDFGR